jgi:hypothetical protein
LRHIRFASLRAATSWRPAFGEERQGQRARFRRRQKCRAGDASKRSIDETYFVDQPLLTCFQDEYDLTFLSRRYPQQQPLTLLRRRFNLYLMRLLAEIMQTLPQQDKRL